MNDGVRTLIVGLGSDFGDDRLGWIAAERLAEQLPTCRVCRVRAPLDLLDHLDGVERLHVIDACRGAGPAGTIVRRDWPADDIATVRFVGTHDFGLVAALQLAERLQRLPPRVTIWCVEATADAEPPTVASPLSPVVAAVVDDLTLRIAAEETPCHA